MVAPNNGVGDPNRSEGFIAGPGKESTNALQASAVSQIRAAVAHLPKEIASQYVASATFSNNPPILGSVKNGDYSTKRPGAPGSVKGSRTGPVKDTPPGGVV